MRAAVRAGDRVDLWLAGVPAPGAPAPPFEQWLSLEERRRADAQLRPAARRQRVIAYAARRAVLSWYVPCDQRAWRFGANADGRPAVVLPPGAPRLDVNVAHTEGLVAVVVARGGDAGVDLERVRARRRLLDVAERCFAAEETAALRQAAPAARPALFATWWTLKESYLKARGVGVWGGVPLDACRFELDEERAELRFRPAPAAEARPDEWRFFPFVPTPDHRGAVAVRAAGDAGLAAFKLAATLDAFAPLAVERRGPVFDLRGCDRFPPPGGARLNRA